MAEGVARKIASGAGVGGDAREPDGGQDRTAKLPGLEAAARDATPAEEAAAAELLVRVERIERQNRWLRYTLVVVVAILAAFSYEKLFPEGVVVQKTLLESKEIKLLDSDGSARLFLRMYSRVPVLQLMDHKGKPRLSLGLRFDDTPFIDLSDRTGQTRATLEMSGDDAPALRLFDADGRIKFQIN